ncbi:MULTISPECIES: flagellar hook-length control protein FliK [unclassified Clostridium]|uniref:flagellar hook-length control protein FliK n=1 Tax=unclassified Clostridium TaxID=2614128 RepID=UPI00321705AB
MEMAQFSVGNDLYKGSSTSDKVKKSEGNKGYSNKEFSKELKNYSTDNESSKTKSVNSIKQEKVKEPSKDYILSSEEVHEGEKLSTSEDMQSLINLIIALLNKKDPSKDEMVSSDLISGNEGKVELQPLLDLLGSEKRANGLLELLSEASINSDMKNKLTELLTLINEDITELDNSSESLMKLLTAEEGIDNDDLISQLQKIVSMKDANKEEEPLNIPRRIELEANVIEKSSVVARVEDNEESSSSKDSKFSKETAILNKVINGEEKDSKVTRAADFMSYFENSVQKSGEVSSEKPIAITKSDLNNDVIKALSYMDKNGVKDLTVKIYPKELGEISISVSMEQGALKAMIKATSKETVEMLALGLKDINEKLNGNNIKIQSVDIGLYEEDTTYYAHGNNQGKAYENGGQRGSENGRQGSEVNIVEEDVIPEANVKASNEIDLLV